MMDRSTRADALRAQLASLRDAGVMQLRKPDAEIVAAYHSKLEATSLESAAIGDSPTHEASTSEALASSSSSAESAVNADVATTASAPVTPTKTQPTPATPSKVETPSGTANAPLSRGHDLQQRMAALKVIREEVAGCTLCDELAASRTQTVFGVGDPQARLCFLGEAPGGDEDEQGEPFVGRAGKLLNKMIAAMGLSRDDVYILNTIKCRPPGNRNPESQESSNCRPFLDRQLAILKPEFICCLGGVAAKNLLQTDLSVGKMRGRFWQYRDAKVVVTYHPAYLLRVESEKRKAWEDLQMLMKEMG